MNNSNCGAGLGSGLGSGDSPACSNSEAISLNVVLSGVGANISAVVGCAGEGGDGSGGGAG